MAVARADRIIGVIALLVLGLVLTKRVKAADEVPIVLSWNAPARADCPDASYVLGEIQRYVGVATGRQGSAIEARATVRRVGLDGFQLLLKTKDREVEGERVFQDESCRAVADAAVVVLAWMIDPDAMANRPVSPPPERRAPPPALPKAAAPSVVPERSPVRPFMALGVAGDVGTLPAAAIGADARLGASFRRYRLAAQVTYWPSRSQAVSTVLDGTTAGGKFALWALSLEGCIDVLPVPALDRMQLSLCTGPEVDLIRATGFGVTVPARASKAWLSLSAGLEARATLTAALRLVFRASGVVPTEREHFALHGVGEIYQPNVVAARGGLGLELGW